MKILLINPPAINEITSQVSHDISDASSVQPPLGLMYISSILLESGFNDVSIIDCQAEKLTYGELESRIRKAIPDVVGITAMTFTMTDVMLTARLVKNNAPKSKIVLGGPHVDIYPKETIKLPEIDYVITREGEYPFLQLVSHIDQGDLPDYSYINNLLWKDCNGDIKCSNTKNEMNNYSLMPFPARDLTNINSYYSIMTNNYPVTTLITAKGCPYECIFCYKHYNKISYRTPNNVVDEMFYIKEMGIREIFFVDDTFYVNPIIAMKICNEMIERKVDIPWGARARVNNISEEMLAIFKKAGCNRLHIGVESGNDRILSNLNKNITTKMAEKAFSLCHKHKIDTLAYFILGNPGETEREAEDTINFAKKLNPSFAQFSRMTPFPATKLYQMALDRHIFENDYWKEYAKNPYNSITPRYWTENFSENRLAELVDYATRQFYVRPRYIFKSLTKIKGLQDLKRKTRTGMKLIISNTSNTNKKLKMT